MQIRTAALAGGSSSSERGNISGTGTLVGGSGGGVVLLTGSMLIDRYQATPNNTVLQGNWQFYDLNIAISDLFVICNLVIDGLLDMAGYTLGVGL